MLPCCRRGPLPSPLLSLAVIQYVFIARFFSAGRTARPDLFAEAGFLPSVAALAVAEYRPPQSRRFPRPCSFALHDTFAKQIFRHLIATSRRHKEEPLRGQQKRACPCLHHRPSLDPLASEENSSPGDGWPMFSFLNCFRLLFLDLSFSSISMCAARAFT